MLRLFNLLHFSGVGSFTVVKLHLRLSNWRLLLTQIMAQASNFHTEDVSTSDVEDGLPFFQNFHKTASQVCNPATS